MMYQQLNPLQNNSALTGLQCRTMLCLWGVVLLSMKRLKGKTVHWLADTDRHYLQEQELKQ